MLPNLLISRDNNVAAARSVDMIARHICDCAFDVGGRQVIYINAGIQSSEILEECAEVIVGMGHVVHSTHLANAVHGQLHSKNGVSIFEPILRPGF